jgi:hypothetical protein
MDRVDPEWFAFAVAEVRASLWVGVVEISGSSFQNESVCLLSVIITLEVRKKSRFLEGDD